VLRDYSNFLVNNVRYTFSAWRNRASIEKTFALASRSVQIYTELLWFILLAKRDEVFVTQLTDEGTRFVPECVQKTQNELTAFVFGVNVRELKF